METETAASLSSEEKQRIIAEVQRRRALQVSGLVIVVVFAAFALLARMAGGSLLGLPFRFWGVVAMALLIAKIIFLILGWRCPACGGQLGPSYSPRFCPNCGIELVPSRES